MGTTIEVNDGPVSVSTTVSMAASSIVLTSSASGRVSSDQLTTMPSKQSIMGDRYTLPVGIWNSVMSVSHFLVGRGSPEVPVEKVVWRRTDLSQV